MVVHMKHRPKILVRNVPACFFHTALYVTPCSLSGWTRGPCSVHYLFRKKTVVGRESPVVSSPVRDLYSLLLASFCCLILCIRFFHNRTSAPIQQCLCPGEQRSRDSNSETHEHSSAPQWGLNFSILNCLSPGFYHPDMVWALLGYNKEIGSWELLF